MNEVTLIGHAGSDPETKVFENARKVATFTLATTEKWEKNGNKQEVTTWHNIVMWGYLADRPVKKGSKVLIKGKIDYRQYEKDGRTFYRTDIVATTCEIIQKLSKINPVESFTSDDDPFTKKGLDSDGFTTPSATQGQMNMGTGNSGTNEADDLPF